MRRLKKLIRFLQSLCGYCPHDRVTWIFRDDAGLYQKCLDCFERLDPKVDFSGNTRVLVRIESSTEKVAQ
jgi:hypothetical protein